MNWMTNDMRYTAVFEFQDGAGPAVGKKDGWLGGELCAVQFSDAIEELGKLRIDMETLREMWSKNSLSAWADDSDTLAKIMTPNVELTGAALAASRERSERG